jgi:hypothetical protein
MPQKPSEYSVFVTDKKVNILRGQAEFPCSDLIQKNHFPAKKM